MNNVKKLQAVLPADSCALITSDVNRRYFTGMKSSAGTAVIFPDAAYLLIDFRYFEKAEEVVRDCTVLLEKNHWEQLNELIKKHGTERIWVESETLTINDYKKLKKNIRGSVSFNISDDLSSAVNKLRMVKTADEIIKMQKAQEIADNAFKFVLENFAREGATEGELARALDFHMLSRGAESVSFDTIVLSGANTSLPHGVPSEKSLQKGEFVLMDFGAVYEGYHSDMTRTFCIGEPSDEMKRVYEIVLEAQMKCLELVRAGVSCKELDACARDLIASKGYGENFGHGLGHSVGMEIHESPAANTRDETILEKNMIMTVEPGIYLPKKFGVRIEDCIAVTENGHINFAASPKNLMII